MASIKRRFDRVAYYVRNITRDISPPILFQRQLDSVLARASDYDPAYLAERVSYYNKLGRRAVIPERARRIGRISLAKSMYYYDLKEHARYFPRRFRLDYLFGDIRKVPDYPAIVKSRPIHADNWNSVVMNLDKFRHFYLQPDGIAFADKKPLAIWRGNHLMAWRREMVSRYFGHRLCDVGFPTVSKSDPYYAPFVPPTGQMAYKYIISIEGNDVATNLKWIMATNSLCLMAPPVYETWFTEGRLEAGKHYAELAPDFADLEEKILYYEDHPDEALAIVGNANRFVEQFLDARREQVISLLVLYKYFVATGQLDAGGALREVMAL